MTDEREKLKIFISYSRADMGFADELAAGLELLGEFDVRLDRESIHEGEAWKARLGALIAEADTVVFVLSPHSAASPICRWEVEEAERLSKRILPVLAVPLEGVAPPPQLAALNYVRFDPDEEDRPRSFVAGLGGVRRALNTDLDWLREHTRLLVRAREWEAAGKAENRLLSGSDITDAKAWLEARPKDAPAPTELHRDFIAASEQAEAQRVSAERQRVMQLEEALNDAKLARQEELAASRRVIRRTKQGVLASLIIGAIGLAGGWGYQVVQENRKFQKEATRDDVRGQIIAYATAQGQVAYDTMPGEKQSPYTFSVVESLRLNKQLSIIEALVAASEKVLQRSNQQQRPFLSSSMNGKLFLWHHPKSRRRIAVVSFADYRDIGNSFLPELQAPPHDAALVMELLKEAGFPSDDVIRLENPKKEDFWKGLDKALERAKRQLEVSQANARPELVLAGFKPVTGTPAASNAPGGSDSAIENSLLLFYFSGNGFSYDGIEYLMPFLKDPPDGWEKRPAEFAIQVSQIKQKIESVFSSSVLVFDTNFPELSEDYKSKLPQIHNRPFFTPETR
jgi:TIR domain/Caspase domain